jgi:ATP-binding cassette subfamily B protein
VATDPSSLARRALAFLRPHRAAVSGIVALTLFMAALAAVEPLVLKLLFDELAPGSASRALLLGVAGLAGLAVLRELAGGATNWLAWRTRIHVHYALTEATVSRLHALPVSFHKAEGVGGTMTRLERGISGLVAALTEIAFQLLPAVVFLAVSIIIMVRLDWRIALVVLAFAPLPAVIAALVAPVQTRRERTLMERWTRIYARFNEVLAGIVTVKSFAMEEVEKKRFLDEVGAANEVVIRGVGLDSGVGAATNLVVAGARLAVLAYGGSLVLAGQMSAGTLIAFLGYVAGLFAPVQGLSNTYRTLRTASVALEQVFSILDATDALEDAPDAVDVPRLTGAVVFSSVRFHYDAARPILEGIDLVVRPGEMIAVVGPSGAGKSTLMSLLQRLYDPTGGAITVDGLDLRRAKQSSLRRQIGIVLQDTLLFNESIKDNIAWGRPGATQDDVEAAARAANAHKFILQLPQGYDTQVGERGGRLSAGERQRIAIARSLIKDPSILILDEPTSALDAESEALVQEALSHLVKGRTTFAIAHRLSTVVEADRILVLRDGRISEEGSHEALMKADGYYASLVRRQTQGLLAA